MPEEHALILHMHELLQYCNRQRRDDLPDGRAARTVGEMQAPIDLTYLADTVILLRYFEASGECGGRSPSSRSAPARTKTRSGSTGSCQGISLGEPLANFQGVLRGVPRSWAASPKRRRRKR